MIVLDLGCYHHPRHPGSSQNSIAALAERFNPTRIVGYDPQPSMPTHGTFSVSGVPVDVYRRAAWLYDGVVSFDPFPPLSARTGPGHYASSADCFDLSRMLARFAADDADLVVKMDVEGAEYPLLRHLLDRGTATLIGLLLVEWHDLPVRARDRDSLLGSLDSVGVEIEEWT